MLHSFTVADVLGTIEAAALLTSFVFVPGYVAGWLTNVFAFREQRLSLRVLLSTPLSVAICPVAVFLLGRFPVALWAFFATIWAAFAVLLVKQARAAFRAQPSREMRIGAAIVLAWAVLVVVSLADLQIGDRLYFNVSAYDHSVRSAFTAAAARSIPPANPFFAADPPIMLRYHYFWMAECSLVTRLAGIAPRHALYGGTIWAGIALMSLIAVALKFFAGADERLGRKTLIGCGLLAVTGLDILPILYLSHFKAPPFPDTEWWNVQITSWVDALLWTPHHVLAMVACVIGFLVLRQPATGKRERAVHVAVAALAFAASSGLSSLVTFTFAVSIAAWLLVSLARRWWDEVALFAVAGALAAVIALPYLRMITGKAASAGAFVGFAVRQFPLADRVLAKHTALSGPSGVVDFLLLPLNYFLELGFFLLVGVLRIWSIRRGAVRLKREEIAAWTMVGTSFLIGSFVQSTTLTSNDLGWRCFLQAQFVFLLWAALVLDHWWSTPGSAGNRTRRAAYIMLLLGLLGTAYQVVTLRIYPMLHDAGIVRGPEWLDSDRQMGRRTLALRSVYDTLSSTLPHDIVVQYNPASPAYVPHLLYSGRDAAIGLPRCGAVFGGDMARCGPRIKTLQSLFVAPEPGDAASLDARCDAYRINALVVTNSDPVWQQPGTWVWNRTPAIVNDYVRAFHCGTMSRNQR
ncbi:MAG: hypothetical protein ACE14L_05170 [Terriglobales bacterium]